MLSEQKDFFVAYIRNISNYINHPDVARCPNLRDGRKALPLRAAIKNLSQSPLWLTVFDIDEKRLLFSKAYNNGMQCDLGVTNHDYAIVVGAHSQPK